MSLMVILKALNLLHMTALRAFISVLFTGFCCCSGWQIELPRVSAQSEVCAKKTESWSSRCCVYLLVLIEADCFDAKTKLTISNGPTFISLNHCIYIVYQFVPSRIQTIDWFCYFLSNFLSSRIQSCIIFGGQFCSFVMKCSIFLLPTFQTLLILIPMDFKSKEFSVCCHFEGD